MILFTRRIAANYLYFSLLIICLAWAVSCRKPPSGDDTLRFSYTYTDEEGKSKYVKDTELAVTFDTVFTSIGSVTKRFTVHNTSKEDIKTSILLAGGSSSQYSMNMNGIFGFNFKDVMIPKKDSIFIFVTVNINPLNQNAPFFVKDSILFLTGANKQDVKLLAYGQDARYIVADPQTGYKVVAGLPQDGYPVRDAVWTKDRPYVVYGWAVIDSACSLTIEPGAKIYFHRNSGLWAYRYSTLIVGNNGSLDDPVLFRGDRLELAYEKDYSQWNRIWINEGVDATINNAIITNAFVGVQVDPLPDETGITITTNSLVKIENTIIKNTANSGVLSRFLNVDMTNCVVTNNGKCGVQLEGGNYKMKHLTIANYLIGDRKASACYVSNKISAPEYELISAMDAKAEFTNCIIYGNSKTEVETYKDKDADLEVLFQNCLIKAKDHSSNFSECLRNEYPQFADTLKLNFQLQATSPAIGKGKPLMDVPFDILGNSRSDKPDLGAYQFGR